MGAKNLYLLAFPVGLMGLVDFIFALLSFGVFQDHLEIHFFIPAAVSIALFLIVVLFFMPKSKRSISAKMSLFFAVSTWCISCFIGAIPIVAVTHISMVDGMFESMSALTTTGATVLDNLDAMPKTFLLYRQFLQWLGGLGVVIFVVAVLPMLNVGGFKLLKSEVPGPVKDDKISPRISRVAHYMWGTYILITGLCMLFYWLAGMSLFDALCHSLTTVSTGGFSTHDASMGYFSSPAIIIVSDVFMILGAVNFALHFRFLQHKQLSTYTADEEFMAFIVFIGVLSVLLFLTMDTRMGVIDDLSYSVFNVVSFMTSTGYVLPGLDTVPPITIALLIICGYLGGCAGSTAGGGKIIRYLLMFKMSWIKLKSGAHQRAVFSVKYHRRAVDSSILQATFAFFWFVILSTVVLTFLVMASGLDFLSAFSAVASCLNVTGPAFGELLNNFKPVSDFGTAVLTLAMLLGRLEYFTVIALLLPTFWRD